MKTFFHYKNENRKENKNDETDIIFLHCTCNNYSIALLGCAKRRNATYSMPWCDDLLDYIGCE